MTDHKRLITAGSRVRLRLAGDDRLVAFVRRGDSAAFEVLYERHSRGLLSFCVYMLGSRHDAEDAVQATFASAYRALRADGRPVALRPWLFTIARNDCLSILRKRQPTVELNGEPALGGDPLRELELREEIRHMLVGLRELPEKQRAALVLAELHGLSQVEIGGVLGVEPEQVKAFVYQARSNLISARRAREADCREIREELATARGAALLRGRLRRHVRSCADCRLYADGVARQRRQLAVLLPLAPSLVLKYRVLEEALGIGGTDPATYAGGVTVAGSVAGTAAEIAGGGVKALAVKMAAGVAVLGASAGVGASVIGVPIGPQEHAPVASRAAHPARRSLLASVGQENTIGWRPSDSALAGGRQVNGPTEVGVKGSQRSTSPTQPGSPAVGGGGALETGAGSPGATGKTPGEISGGGAGESEGRAPETGGSEQERQKDGEGDQRLSQERQKKREEDERQSRERKQGREERQQSRQERKQLREEHLPGGRSRPPRTEEERQKKREEHPRVGGSRPPPTEEELRKRREAREQRRRERQEQK